MARPPRWNLGGLEESATTYFPAEQYHRRLRLNFCVRDGNRCDPQPMITDKARFPVSRERGCDQGRTTSIEGCVIFGIKRTGEPGILMCPVVCQPDPMPGGIGGWSE